MARHKLGSSCFAFSNREEEKESVKKKEKKEKKLHPLDKGGLGLATAYCIEDAGHRSTRVHVPPTPEVLAVKRLMPCQKGWEGLKKGDWTKSMHRRGYFVRVDVRIDQALQASLMGSLRSYNEGGSAPQI